MLQLYGRRSGEGGEHVLTYWHLVGRHQRMLPNYPTKHKDYLSPNISGVRVRNCSIYELSVTFDGNKGRKSVIHDCTTSLYRHPPFVRKDLRTISLGPEVKHSTCKPQRICQYLGSSTKAIGIFKK